MTRSPVDFFGVTAEAVEEVVVGMVRDYPGEKDGDEEADHQKQVGQRKHLLFSCLFSEVVFDRVGCFGQDMD